MLFTVSSLSVSSVKLRILENFMLYLRNTWSLNLRAIESCVCSIRSIECKMRSILRTVWLVFAISWRPRPLQWTWFLLGGWKFIDMGTLKKKWTQSDHIYYTLKIFENVLLFLDEKDRLVLGGLHRKIQILAAILQARITCYLDRYHSVSEDKTKISGWS